MLMGGGNLVRIIPLRFMIIAKVDLLHLIVVFDDDFKIWEYFLGMPAAPSLLLLFLLAIAQAVEWMAWRKSRYFLLSLFRLGIY